MKRGAVVAFLALIACELGGICFAAEPDATPGEWKFISDKEGVALYRRQRGILNETKAIGEIAASSDSVHAVLDDVESYTSFMPYTAECRVLKRDNDSVIAYQRISAPMTSDRDYTVRIRWSSKRSEHGMVYSYRWETDNAAGPPQKRGVVRVNLCEGSWLLEPTGPHTSRATYMMYIDSGGMIPKFIRESVGQIGIRKLFAAIQKQVANPKYKMKG